MSALDIYGFYQDGDAHQYKAIKNSWGGGWAVWEILTEKYGCIDGGFGSSKFKDLWDKCTAGGLSDEDTITCLFTFDWAWVEKENMVQLAENLLTFGREHGKANILPSAGHLLKDASKDDNIIGVSFNMSNVSESLWYRFSEEIDEYEPYNVLTGTDHWEIFQEFERIRHRG
jgi:hypothetical protein